MSPIISTARGIILADNKVILIKRNKNGAEYWVTPGGEIHSSETPQDAFEREANEELNISVRDSRLVLEIQENRNGIEHHDYYFLAYLATAFSGEIFGEEAKRSSAANVYQPQLVDRTLLGTINLVPECLKNFIDTVLLTGNIEYGLLDLR